MNALTQDAGFTWPKYEGAYWEPYEDLVSISYYLRHEPDAEPDWEMSAVGCYDNAPVLASATSAPLLADAIREFAGSMMALAEEVEHLDPKIPLSPAPASPS
jgi:hypothetical protein